MGLPPRIFQRRGWSHHSEISIHAFHCLFLLEHWLRIETNHLYLLPKTKRCSELSNDPVRRYAASVRSSLGHDEDGARRPVTQSIVLASCGKGTVAAPPSHAQRVW